MGLRDRAVPGIELVVVGLCGQAANGIRAASRAASAASRTASALLRAYFKPASTVGAMATSGRHDPCIVPRAVPVLEAMAALALADLALAARLDQM